jgi:hypothetical protein
MEREYEIKHRILKNGTEKWTRYNPDTRKHEFHRLNGPAFIDQYGNKEYYIDGVRNRKKGPTFVGIHGQKKWHVDGVLHREDGPAVIGWSKNEEYYINGKLHREDGPAVIYGPDNKEWYYEGQLHRLDGPAIIEPNGYERWYKHGELHRTDGPAEYKTSSSDMIKDIEKAADDIDKILSKETSIKKIAKKLEALNDYNRSIGKVGNNMYDHEHEVSWYINGERHRLDGPAHINEEGSQFWYKNGMLHRTDGPAIECGDSDDNEWYLDGELHREDGPAKIDYGVEEWYKKGELHREDGPAKIYTDNEGRCEWYLNGRLHRSNGPAIYNNETIDEGDIPDVRKLAEEFKDLIIKIKDSKNPGDYLVSINRAQKKYTDLEEEMSSINYHGRSMNQSDDPDDIDLGYFYHGKQITKDELVIAEVGLGDLL